MDVWISQAFGSLGNFYLYNRGRRCGVCIWNSRRHVSVEDSELWVVKVRFVGNRPEFRILVRKVAAPESLVCLSQDAGILMSKSDFWSSME